MARKKNKVPFLLRVIPKVFPFVELIAPPLARKFFVTIFFRPFRYEVPPKESEILSSADSYVENVGGKNVQCYSWGNTSLPTVLLVHGWAGRAGQFRKIIPALLHNKYRVLAFDAPAHGRSDGKETSIEEFHLVIDHLSRKPDINIVASITHSFGGAATLYSISKGLKLMTVINIGTPTVADLIINTFLAAVGGSKKTGNYIREHVIKRTGKPFEDFTIMGFVGKLPANLNILLIHDKDDADASVENAYELAKAYPVELFITEGLGHTRILRDDAAIRKAVTFIQAHSSSSRVLEPERNSG